MSVCRKRSIYRRAVRRVAALALCGGAIMNAPARGQGFAESGGPPCKNGCPVNTQSFAWHATQWRRWPGTRKVMPSPGRGDQIEPVTPRTQFDMPAPSARETSPSPRMQGAGVRSPIVGPRRPQAEPRLPSPTLPESATGTDIPTAPSMEPPAGLFNDDDFSAPDGPPDVQPDLPANEQENESPTDVPEPPLDAIGKSPPPRQRDPQRTLGALTAGLRGIAAPAAEHPPLADAWRATSARQVSEESQMGEGPILNEPNLMSAPHDSPMLETVPLIEEAPADVHEAPMAPAEQAATSDITPTASWTAADDVNETIVESSGRNPLRATSGSSGGRRNNPLRRR